MPSKPRYCCVCTNNSLSRDLNGDRISLHRFPSDEKIRDAWIRRCKLVRAGFSFGSYDSTRLCAHHFEGKKGPSKEKPLPVLFENKTFKTSHFTAPEKCSDPLPVEGKQVEIVYPKPRPQITSSRRHQLQLQPSMTNTQNDTPNWTMPSKPRWCCVCTNNSLSRDLNGDRISLHRFPTDGKIRDAWIQRCKLVCAGFSFGSYDSTRLCSHHFEGKKGPSKEKPLPVLFENKTFERSHFTAPERFPDPLPVEGKQVEIVYPKPRPQITSSRRHQLQLQPSMTNTQNDTPCLTDRSAEMKTRSLIDPNALHCVEREQKMEMENPVESSHGLHTDAWYKHEPEIEIDNPVTSYGLHSDICVKNEPETDDENQVASYGQHSDVCVKSEPETDDKNPVKSYGYELHSDVSVKSEPKTDDKNPVKSYGYGLHSDVSVKSEPETDVENPVDMYVQEHCAVVFETDIKNESEAECMLRPQYHGSENVHCQEEEMRAEISSVASLEESQAELSNEETVTRSDSHSFNHKCCRSFSPTHGQQAKNNQKLPNLTPEALRKQRESEAEQRRCYGTEQRRQNPVSFTPEQLQKQRESNAVVQRHCHSTDLLTPEPEQLKIKREAKSKQRYRWQIVPAGLSIRKRRQPDTDYHYHQNPASLLPLPLTPAVQLQQTAIENNAEQQKQFPYFASTRQLQTTTRNLATETTSAAAAPHGTTTAMQTPTSVSAADVRHIGVVFDKHNGTVVVEPSTVKGKVNVRVILKAQSNWVRKMEKKKTETVYKSV